MATRQRRGYLAPAPQPSAPAVDLAAARSRLRTVIEPVVTGAGYDLEIVAVKRMGRRHVVAVTVDRDGGVGLDGIADLARELSAAIDAAEAATGEVIAGEYQLEVSSPGTDRPLRLPRHWRRNTGRLVRVSAGGRAVVGRVVEATESGVRLDLGGDVHVYAYADLGPGRVEIEFNRLDEVDDDDLAAFGDEADDDDPGAGDAEEEDER